MRISNLYLTVLKPTYQDKDFSFLVLCITLFLLPLSVNLSSFTLIVSIGLKLLQVFFFSHPLFRAKSLMYSSIIGLVFFTYILLSSFAQNGFQDTFDVFGKQFSHWELLFLMPILLRKPKDNILLCYFFFSGLIISILYVLIMSYIFGMTFNNRVFLEVVDIHHTYLCLFLLFFVNFLLVKYKNENPLTRIVYGVFIILSFFMIFILESKVSIVVFCILLLYHFISFYSKKNIPGYIGLLVALVLSIFLFNKRLKVSYENALDFRSEIWKESISLIETNPFFGSLKHSEKDLLNYGHYVSGKYYFMDSDLNSHNQYLSIIMKYGFLGILILLFFGVLYFKTINKTSSKESLKEFFGFTIIVLIIFHIENLMDRHHGIVFCTLFYNYYLINVQNENV